MNETIYELKSGDFQGPLTKLLELIQDKKLEITNISLAEVTADFLSYLKSLEKTAAQKGRASSNEINRDSRIIADFIIVAAKLILIKSHSLLPQIEFTSEEKEEMSDLQNRLKLYKEFKTVEGHIRSLWLKGILYSRDYFYHLPSGFYLSQPIKAEDLASRMAKLTEELSIFFPKQDSVRIKLLNLEEKIMELIQKVDKVFRTSFNEVTKDKERSEIIVLFLALLHLLKDNLVVINQTDGFSDIEITSIKENGTR